MVKVGLQSILTVYSVTCTSAVRIKSEAWEIDGEQAARKAKLEVSKTRDDVNNDLTTFIEPFDSAGVAHCCCDSAGRFEFFGYEDRTNECHIFLGQSCGSLTQEDLKNALGRGEGGSKPLRVHSGSPSGRCVVDADRVDELAQQVLQTTSQSEDPAAPGSSYCEPLMEDGHEIQGSALGGRVTVTCGFGHEPSHDTSICKYETPDAGVLDPAPHCRRINDFCPRVRAHSSPGIRQINQAAYGFQRSVSCDFAYVPVERRVRCAENRTFVPTPECVMDPSFCAAFDSEGASAGSAALDGESEVSCTLGKVPDVPVVECQRSRSFSPTPKCNPIPDFCKAVPANADGLSISEAALGEEGIVSCLPGFRVERQGGVICGEDGQFSFATAPVCHRASDWCAQVSDYTSHIREVPSAGLGYRRNVICVTGTQAEVEQVRCGEDGLFHPTPTCS